MTDIHRACLVLAALAAGCAAPAGPPAPPAPAAALDLAARGRAIHEAAFTIDTHDDWPTRQLESPDFDPGIRHRPGAPGSGQWDLPRMKEGGLDAVFLSIFTPQGDLTGEGRRHARETALEEIRLAEEMAGRHADLAELAFSPADAERIERSGRRALFLGMENGYPLGEDLSAVEMFYRKGIRYITLCHGRNNDVCDSSTDPEARWGGLSPFGEKVVREMNRLGILVDVSHVSDETFRDVMRITRAPVIASHSSARALCDVPRNMTDDMLRSVRENGGVVQVCLVGGFIRRMPPDPEREAALDPIREALAALRRGELEGSEAERVRARYRRIEREHPRPRPDLRDAVDQIDHMVQVMGVDHVGIGTDFDGGGGMRRLDDVTDLPRLTEEMLRRGYTEGEIRKIWGGNLLRVFREAERVARGLQAEAARGPAAD